MFIGKQGLAGLLVGNLSCLKDITPVRHPQGLFHVRVDGIFDDPSGGNFGFRKEARISLGIQKRRATRIPAPKDPRMV